jgi:MFS superfamily sulfate permease-like transporter
MKGSVFSMLGPTPTISAILQTCWVKYGMASLPFISVASGLFVYLIAYYGLEKYIDLFPVYEI